MKLFKWLATAAMIAALSATGHAQSDQGKISGSVRDQSNAFVADATVMVKNERTAESRSTTSNGQGVFFIGGLKPSMYTIRVEKQGFAPIEYTNLELAVGRELTLDFEFRPAGVQEQVTVVGTTTVVNLTSASLSVNVSEREVQNLPVNGRQMSQLMLQAPGAQNSGTGTWQEIRFSGRAVEQNVVRHDGIEASAIIDSAPGNANGEIATPFKLQASLETVQEFRVESSNFPAEFGTGTGGQVSVITKSGSNLMHGSLFEFLRSDKLDAPNYFDTSRNADGSPTAAGLNKTPLKQNQFGVSFGGPLMKDRAFFFGSYEGYRLNAGLNLIEAVPSNAAWSRAVSAVAPLRPAFLGTGAVIVAGASTNPDFDVAQLQATQDVQENAFSARFDVKLNSNWSSYFRVSHDKGVADIPESVGGRFMHVVDSPTNAVFNLQGVLSPTTINEIKFGYNAAPTEVSGVLANPIINGIDVSRIIVNLSGSVANNGIAGQGASSGIVIPGGLVRSNSSTNGRGQPYDPYSLTVADSLSVLKGSHSIKLGGESRTIRMTTNRLGGLTYSYSNLTNFLANTASSVRYDGDLSDPSVFNAGATGDRNIRQQYFIAYAQDEWRMGPKVTLNYGLRYDYYQPLTEANNFDVKFNIDTGVIEPSSTPFYKSRKDNFQPRLALTFSPDPKTVLRGGFGIFVGPGQTEDQIQPIESDRISTSVSNVSNAFPADQNALIANFINNPNNRSYQPRAYANEYTLPERVYQYTASVQRELGTRTAVTVAYVGSQGRDLFLRSVANRITGVFTNPDPTKAGIVVREFSIVTARDAAGNPTAVQNPFAEIDYKTSGGHDEYNALQLSLTRRASRGLALNAQYTLSKSFGNTGGSNEALTAGNLARTLDQFDYDLGYNMFDVRHNFSFSALYQIPYGKGRQFGADASGVKDALLGGWEVGGIANARSGLPIDVRITRPDIVYQDALGNVFNNPAAGRIAIINTPGGGNTRDVRRPDLVPGVDPYIDNGGLVFLNPAAFSTPKPGTNGNLQRGYLHGPNFKQVDLLISKRFALVGTSNFEFRTEVFNLFNADNFTNPVARLNNVLPNNASTEANTLQPGQAYTSAPAGTFGRLTSTVARTVGLGTSRQVQFGFRVSF